MMKLVNNIIEQIEWLRPWVAIALLIVVFPAYAAENSTDQLNIGIIFVGQDYLSDEDLIVANEVRRFLKFKTKAYIRKEFQFRTASVFDFSEEVAGISGPENKLEKLLEAERDTTITHWLKLEYFSNVLIGCEFYNSENYIPSEKPDWSICINPDLTFRYPLNSQDVDRQIETIVQSFSGTRPASIASVISDNTKLFTMCFLVTDIEESDDNEEWTDTAEEIPEKLVSELKSKMDIRKIDVQLGKCANDDLTRFEPHYQLSGKIKEHQHSPNWLVFTLSVAPPGNRAPIYILNENGAELKWKTRDQHSVASGIAEFVNNRWDFYSDQLQLNR